MVNNVSSNDMAVSKAESLSQEHNVKATAYKVDGESPNPGLLSLGSHTDRELVSNPDTVQSKILEVVSDFGKLDVFIANAGKDHLSLGYYIYTDMLSRDGNFETASTTDTGRIPQAVVGEW